MHFVVDKFVVVNFVVDKFVVDNFVIVNFVVDDFVVDNLLLLTWNSGTVERMSIMMEASRKIELTITNTCTISVLDLGLA